MKFQRQYFKVRLHKLYDSLQTWCSKLRIKYEVAWLLSQNKKIRVVIGSGYKNEAEWIATDINVLNVLNIKEWQYLFGSGVVDALLAEHVWEHLTPQNGILAAFNCYKYLKPGGYLRVGVPDGFHPDADYINYVKPGGHGDGAEDHKILYNFRLLGSVFEQVGFKIDILEYFDENGIFHYKEWSPKDGMIYRSKRFDERNQNGILNYTSLIIDAKKT